MLFPRTVILGNKVTLTNCVIVGFFLGEGEQGWGWLNIPTKEGRFTSRKHITWLAKKSFLASCVAYLFVKTGLACDPYFESISVCCTKLSFITAVLQQLEYQNCGTNCTQSFLGEQCLSKFTARCVSSNMRRMTSYNSLVEGFSTIFPILLCNLPWLKDIWDTRETETREV